MAYKKVVLYNSWRIYKKLSNILNLKYKIVNK